MGAKVAEATVVEATVAEATEAEATVSVMKRAVAEGTMTKVTVAEATVVEAIATESRASLAAAARVRPRQERKKRKGYSPAPPGVCDKDESGGACSQDSGRFQRSNHSLVFLVQRTLRQEK